MLYSMTGYGDAQWEDDGISLVVEIRSLNNRFLKTTIKLPDALAFAEAEIARAIRGELCRGSVMYTLHMRSMDEGGAFDVNEAALQHYLRHLEAVASGGTGTNHTIDMAILMQLPGVCQAHEYSEEEHQRFLDMTLDLTNQALGRLREMRAEEGKGLWTDLQEQLRVIREHLDALLELAVEVPNEYRRRLEQRVSALLAQVDLKLEEDMLAKEVAVFADRSDINEEVQRLGSHLEQFAEACRSGEEVQTGRRLDFLAQEMLREANTIGSKANDAKISQHVVEIKVAIDRLKEQVQNIE